MIKSVMRGSAVVAAALACLTGALTAQAATAPRWRLEQLVGSPADETDPAVGYGDSAIAASGPNSAWSIWETGTLHGSSETIVEHWSGRRWSPVASRELRGLSTPVAVAASSASDAWIFSRFNPGEKASARHWNGSAWSTRSVPSWVIRSNLSGQTDVQTADFGRRNLWVFSLGQESIPPTAPYAARYENGRWRKAGLPAIPSAISAVSPSDIWALGAAQSSPSRQVLMHWDGLRWHTRRLPRQKLPAKTTGYFSAVAGSGPRSVWVSFSTETGLQGAVTRYLMHWTGHWSKVALAKGTSEINLLSPDGHGGLWASGNGPKPRYPSRFFHLSRGHWTTVALPGRAGLQVPGVDDLARVPGSEEMLAVGHGYVTYKGNADNIGLIWRYSS